MRIGAMFVGMMAVDPQQVALFHLVPMPLNARPSPTPDTQNELVAGKMITLDVVMDSRDQMASARDCIKHFLMSRTGHRM
jgi:hypothetical protein